MKTTLLWEYISDNKTWSCTLTKISNITLLNNLFPNFENILEIYDCFIDQIEIIVKKPRINEAICPLRNNFQCSFYW